MYLGNLLKRLLGYSSLKDKGVSNGSPLVPVFFFRMKIAL